MANNAPKFSLMPLLSCKKHPICNNSEVCFDTKRFEGWLWPAVASSKIKTKGSIKSLWHQSQQSATTTTKSYDVKVDIKSFNLAPYLVPNSTWFLQKMRGKAGHTLATMWPAKLF